MSYQALARTWRPQTFAEVIGQPHVVKAISNGIAQQRLHHAFLFSGTRGVGKTTIARLLAKSLNCEQGPTPTPCGVCSACVGIKQGNFVDLIEIDAASRTKVEDTRELLENVQYRPTQGRFKVYLIDEVHMLSKHSFNALLKTLEEPPPHVKFLLATTDPQKLPITILSRCLQFNLRSLSVDEIAGYLQQVLNAEHIAYEQPALIEIARAAQGSMRDALSLTDQAIAHGGGNAAYAAVCQMLGTVQREQLIGLLSAVVKGDGNSALAQVDHLAQYSPNFDKLLSELADALHRIAMLQQLGVAQSNRNEALWQGLPELAEQLAPEMVQLYYRFMLEGRRELPLSPDPRIALEMTLLRCLSFRPQGTVPDVTGSSTNSASTQQQTRLLTPVAVSAKPESSESSTETPVVVPDPVTSGIEAQHVKNEARQDMTKPQENVSAAEPDAKPAWQSDDELMLSMQDALDSEQAQILLSAEELGYNSAITASESSAAAATSNQQASPSSDPVPAPVRPAHDTGTGKVLEARTILRSRKLGLERKGKKFEGLGAAATNPEPVNVPRTESLLASASPSSTVNVLPQAGSDQLVAGKAVHPDKVAEDVETSSIPEGIDSKAGLSQSEKKGLPTDDHWSQIIEQCGVDGIVRQLAINSVLLEQGSCWRLLLAPEQKHLATEQLHSQLVEALGQLTGTAPTLVIEIGQLDDRETPLQIQKRLEAERLAQAKAVIYQDENIQFFIEQCSATVDDESICAMT